PRRAPRPGSHRLPRRLRHLRRAAAPARGVPVGAAGGARPPAALPRPRPAHLGAAANRAAPSGRRTARRRHGPLDTPRHARQSARISRMTIPPRTAMLLAAGLRQRMRPLTAHTAKPLLTLSGKTLMDHALDHLAE